MRGAAASQHGAEDHPGVGKPREHPCSLLFPEVGTVGELPCPRPAAQTWGCSASPLAVLLASGPAFWLGFEAPLTFAISGQPRPVPPNRVTEVPLALGDAGLQ